MSLNPILVCILVSQLLFYAHKYLFKRLEFKSLEAEQIKKLEKEFAEMKKKVDSLVVRAGFKV